MLRFLLCAFLVAFASGAAVAADKTKSLSDLTCTNGQVPKFDGTDWVCAVDETGAVDALNCGNGQIAKFQNGNWVCTADETGAVDALACSEGQVPKFVGGQWTCATDATGINTDTLGNLNCSNGQIAKFDGTQWICATDATGINTDTLANICAAGDFLRRDPNSGEWVCLNSNQMKLALGIVRPVFVTSGRYIGNLITVAQSLDPSFNGDGLQAGDLICNHHATAAGLQLPYVAWLSSSNTNAPDRIGFGPYIGMDGNEIATTKADLTDGEIATAISRNENGTSLADQFPLPRRVWTGTTPDGAQDFNCVDWSETTIPTGGTFSGTTGDLGSVDGNWTDNGIIACTSLSRLYCFPK